MLDINVKTIDGQNRSYSVPDSYSVKQFKEKIANSLNIPVERQRLIFQGRELKDHSLLSEFDVNGKTLHLVQRAPPVPGQPAPQSQEQQQQQANQRTNAPPEIQNLLQQIMGGLGAELGQNVTINTTDQNGMEVHINVENTPSTTTQNTNEIRARVRNIRRFLTMAHSRLHRLNEIQSGAPLDDSQNTAIIVGSIQTTATLTDGSNNTIAFDTMPTAIIPPIHIPLSYHQAPAPAAPTTPVPQPAVNAETTPAAASNSTSAPAEPLTSTASAAQTTADETASNSSSTGSSRTTTTTPSANANGSNENINVEVLADLISSVMDAYSQFQPYLQQYRDMLINDANEPPESPRTSTASTSATAEAASASGASTTSTPGSNTPQTAVGGSGVGDNRRQRFCNNINDMMHLLGHLFHNLSDLHINIRDRPPRQMHTMTTMQYTTSTVISAVPVEANIQLPFPFPGAGAAASAAAPRRTQTPSAASQDGTPNSSSQPAPPPDAQANQNISRSRSTSSTSSVNQSTENDSTRNRTESERSRSRLSRQPPPPLVPLDDLAAQQNAARLAASAAAQVLAQLNPAQAAANPHLQQHMQQHQQHVQQNIHLHHQPHVHGIPMATRLPMSAAASSPLNSYDQFLPCNSVHFYNTINPLTPGHAIRTPGANLTSQLFQRRRQPTGVQPSSTATPTSTPTATTSATNANDIGRLVSNLLTSQLRPPAPGSAPRADIPGAQHIRINLGGMPAQMTFNTIPGTGVNAAQANRGAPAGSAPRPPLPDFLNQASTILSQLFGGAFGAPPAPAAPAAPQSNTNQQQQQANPGSGAPRGQQEQPARESPSQVANMLLREAFSLLHSNNPNDQRMNQPVQELLRSMGAAEADESGNSQDSEQEESSSLNIFNVFFSSMSLGDMINWAQGQSMNQVFERSRLPLRNYIRRTFGSSENTDTESIINSVVESLYTDMFIESAGLNIDLTQFELTDEAVRQRIDFPKSFEKLMKHHLRILLRHVFDPSYDNVTTTPTNSADANSWSSVIIRKFTDLTNQMIALCRTCIKNADQKFIQIVTEKLNHAIADQEFMNMGLFDNIFNPFITNRLRTILDGVTLTRSSIEQFIMIKEEPKPAASEPAVTATPVAASGAQLPAKETGTKTKTSVFVEDDEDEKYDSASSTISGHSMDIDQCVSSYKAANNSNVTAKADGQQQRSQLTAETRPSAASSSSASGPGAEPWSQVFPSEWCSTIERDIETQKNQPSPVASFSDAYNSGLPAKRRKVLVHKSVDLLNETLFKKVLRRTMDQMELKPNVNQADLVDTSISNSQLISSFDSELNTAITERLKNDKDFQAIIKDDDPNADRANERFKHSRKRLN